MDKVGSQGEPDGERMQEGRRVMSNFSKKLWQKSLQDYIFGRKTQIQTLFFGQEWNGVPDGHVAQKGLK